MVQHKPRDSLDEAIEWHLRLRDHRPEDWDAFVLWLEEDPQRSIAYDTVALADADITAESIPFQPTSQPVALPSYRRWGWVAAAASVIIVGGTVALVDLHGANERYEIATAAGEQRRVAIGEGSFAELNGTTRLALQRDNPREVELVSGEATFTVRHDPTHPFIVMLGDDKLQDVGTVFNVVRESARTRVDVLEGQVLFNPEEDGVSLGRGRSLVSLNSEDRIIVRDKKVEEMAGWRAGQLSFTDEPLLIVASDLSRTIGKAVEVDRDLANRPFTGSITLKGDESVRQLAATLGATARRKNSGWVIEPSERARP